MSAEKWREKLANLWWNKALTIDDAHEILLEAVAEAEASTIEKLVGQEEAFILKHRRGLRPGQECDKCKGWGTYTYSNGATWHGGMGVSSYTKDVCDKCWGSGSNEVGWQDLRALANALKNGGKTP